MTMTYAEPSVVRLDSIMTLGTLSVKIDAFQII